MKNRENLVKEIKKLVQVQCLHKNTTMTKLSIKLGKNEKYLSNKFNAGNTIAVSVIYEIAEALQCEPAELLPSLESN